MSGKYAIQSTRFLIDQGILLENDNWIQWNWKECLHSNKEVPKKSFLKQTQENEWIFHIPKSIHKMLLASLPTSSFLHYLGEAKKILFRLMYSSAFLFKILRRHLNTKYIVPTWCFQTNNCVLFCTKTSKWWKLIPRVFIIPIEQSSKCPWQEQAVRRAVIVINCIYGCENYIYQEQNYNYRHCIHT